MRHGVLLCIYLSLCVYELVAINTSSDATRRTG